MNRNNAGIIRGLHNRKPLHNLRTALVFLALWAGATALALHTDWLAVRAACWLLSGMVIQGFGILMHEGVHGILARNRSVNRWLAFLCGAPAMLSVSAYRAVHLPHHRHERTDQDPDELENVTRDPRRLALLFCVVFAAGHLYLSRIYGPLAATRERGAVRRDILVEYAIILAAFGAAFTLSPLRVMVDAWILPVLLAAAFTNARTLAEHALTVPSDRLSATRTVLSNRFVSGFMCNLNYHTAHHLYPGVPWYNLPALHRLLEADFAAAGVQVYRSYTRFLFDLAVFIVRAFGPRGRTLALRLPVSSRATPV